MLRPVAPAWMSARSAFFAWRQCFSVVWCWCEVPVLGCAQQPGRSQAGKSTACREAMEQQAESQKVRKSERHGQQAMAPEKPHTARQRARQRRSTTVHGSSHGCGGCNRTPPPPPATPCRPGATPMRGHCPRTAARARLKFKASVHFVPTSTPDGLWSVPFSTFQESNMPIIAWLLGVPITVIILLMLFGVF